MVSRERTEKKAIQENGFKVKREINNMNCHQEVYIPRPKANQQRFSPGIQENLERSISADS